MFNKRTFKLTVLIILSLLALIACEKEVEVTKIVTEKETVVETVVEKETVIETVIESQEVIVTPTPAPFMPGGQIIFATRISELETLHPFTTRLGRAQAVSYHINEGLTKFTPTAQIVPGLAESWEVDDDDIVYTFHLRQGVTWHDGQPFTSNDVKFTFDAAMAEDSQSRAKGALQTHVQDVAAPDDSTVVLSLKQPHSPLLATLADQLFIVPAHILEGNIYDEDFAKFPIGTGPYKIKDHEIDYVSLEYNPDYWGPLPYTALIFLKDSPEATAQVAGLLAGELDVVAYIPTVMGNLWAQGYPIYKAPAGSVHGINLDLQNPFLQDVNVRKALMMGLDRRRIQALHYTDGFVADTVVSPAYGAYRNTDLQAVPYDVEGANALLEEAGWILNEDSGVREKDGEPFKIQHYAWTAKQWQDIATIAQASWKQLGIDVEVVVVENALIAETISGRYDAAPVGWSLTLDPIVGLNLLFHSTDRTFQEGGTRNIFHYDNPQVDSLLMRFTMLSMPTFFLVLAAAALLGPSLLNTVVIIGVTRWMGVARLMRGEYLAAREKEYVLAARVIGASDWRIIRQILPNVFPTLIVAATLAVASGILTESALSYLGLGTQPPEASWGYMLSGAQAYIWVAPRLGIYPGVLIMTTVMGVNFIGDGLRDALDPRLGER